MRELEFLPGWYPRLRRRKRMMMLQAWMTLIIILGLALWLVLARRNVRSAEFALGTFEAQMRQTETEKRQLEEQLSIKTQLEQRERIVASLGFPVEMSRLLGTLDVVMPREMSLKDITCRTVEQTTTPSGPAAARAVHDRNQPLDRRLEVTLVGVAPNDVDLANFLAGLTNYPFLEQVALVRAGGRSDAGHLMREFEVTFSISLNTVPGQ